MPDIIVADDSTAGLRAALAPPGPDRRRVLLAPVTVTPSKPLAPSHLKGLLWTDVMYRATSVLADVSYRYSPTTYHVTEQTLGFWEFLDRTVGAADYSGMTEVEIGEFYVRFRAEVRAATAATLRPYAEAVESQGWVHPAARRVLELWASHYRRLGMHDPGLLAHQPPGMTLPEMIDRLSSLGMCLDLSAYGSPVFLDATRYGLPLRQIVDTDGRPNYLACALRELLPLAPLHDEVVLLYDPELGADYLLLERVLLRLGVTVRRVAVGRVPVEGRIRSARQGGWHGYGAGDLLAAACAEHRGDDAVRLGMRLYFIAALGPGQAQSFRHDTLRRCLGRAARLLAAADGDGAPMTEVLARHRGDHAHVDPYRLTSGLLARHKPTSGRELLAKVYL